MYLTSFNAPLLCNKALFNLPRRCSIEQIFMPTPHPQAKRPNWSLEDHGHADAPTRNDAVRNKIIAEKEFGLGIGFLNATVEFVSFET